MAAAERITDCLCRNPTVRCVNRRKGRRTSEALRSVMDEVLHTAESSLRKNTARVLLHKL